MNGLYANYPFFIPYVGSTINDLTPPAPADEQKAAVVQASLVSFVDREQSRLRAWTEGAHLEDLPEQPDMTPFPMPPLHDVPRPTPIVCGCITGREGEDITINQTFTQRIPDVDLRCVDVRGVDYSEVFRYQNVPEFPASTSSNSMRQPSITDMVPDEYVVTIARVTNRHLSKHNIVNTRAILSEVSHPGLMAVEGSLVDLSDAGPMHQCLLVSYAPLPRQRRSFNPLHRIGTDVSAAQPPTPLEQSVLGCISDRMNLLLVLPSATCSRICPFRLSTTYRSQTSMHEGVAPPLSSSQQHSRGIVAKPSSSSSPTADSSGLDEGGPVSPFVVIRDTAASTPPVFPIGVSSFEQMETERFRPEFVRDYAEPLVPTACYQECPAGSRLQATTAVFNATLFLMNVTIPTVAQSIDLSPVSGADLCERLHMFGVNNRYLGWLLPFLRKQSSAQIVLTEIAARSYRHLKWSRDKYRRRMFLVQRKRVLRERRQEELYDALEDEVRQMDEDCARYGGGDSNVLQDDAAGRLEEIFQCSTSAEAQERRRLHMEEQEDEVLDGILAEEADREIVFQEMTAAAFRKYFPPHLRIPLPKFTRSALQLLSRLDPRYGIMIDTLEMLEEANNGTAQSDEDDSFTKKAKDFPCSEDAASQSKEGQRGGVEPTRRAMLHSVKEGPRGTFGSNVPAVSFLTIPGIVDRIRLSDRSVPSTPDVSTAFEFPSLITADMVDTDLLSSRLAELCDRQKIAACPGIVTSVSRERYLQKCSTATLKIYLAYLKRALAAREVFCSESRPDRHSLTVESRVTPLLEAIAQVCFALNPLEVNISDVSCAGRYLHRAFDIWERALQESGGGDKEDLVSVRLCMIAVRYAQWLLSTDQSGRALQVCQVGLKCCANIQVHEQAGKYHPLGETIGVLKVRLLWLAGDAISGDVPSSASSECALSTDAALSAYKGAASLAKGFFPLGHPLLRFLVDSANLGHIIQSPTAALFPTAAGQSHAVPQQAFDPLSLGFSVALGVKLDGLHQRIIREQVAAVGGASSHFIDCFLHQRIFASEPSVLSGSQTFLGLVARMLTSTDLDSQQPKEPLDVVTVAVAGGKSTACREVVVRYLQRRSLTQVDPTSSQLVTMRASEPPIIKPSGKTDNAGDPFGCWLPLYLDISVAAPRIIKALCEPKTDSTVTLEEIVHWCLECEGFSDSCYVQELLSYPNLLILFETDSFSGVEWEVACLEAIHRGLQRENGYKVLFIVPTAFLSSPSALFFSHGGREEETSPAARKSAYFFEALPVTSSQAANYLIKLELAGDKQEVGGGCEGSLMGLVSSDHVAKEMLLSSPPMLSSFANALASHLRRIRRIPDGSATSLRLQTLTDAIDILVVEGAMKSEPADASLRCAAIYFAATAAAKMTSASTSHLDMSPAFKPFLRCLPCIITSVDGSRFKFVHPFLKAYFEVVPILLQIVAPNTTSWPSLASRLLFSRMAPSDFPFENFYDQLSCDPHSIHEALLSITPRRKSSVGELNFTTATTTRRSSLLQPSLASLPPSRRPLISTSPTSSAITSSRGQSPVHQHFSSILLSPGGAPTPSTKKLSAVFIDEKLDGRVDPPLSRRRHLQDLVRVATQFKARSQGEKLSGSEWMCVSPVSEAANGMLVKFLCDRASSVDRFRRVLERLMRTFVADLSSVGWHGNHVGKVSRTAKQTFIANCVVIFAQSRMPLSGLSLRGVDFSGCSLNGATLFGCDLRDATFKRTAIHGTCFDCSDMSGAELGGLEVTPRGVNWVELPKPASRQVVGAATVDEYFTRVGLPKLASRAASGTTGETTSMECVPLTTHIILGNSSGALRVVDYEENASHSLPVGSLQQFSTSKCIDVTPPSASRKKLAPIDASITSSSATPSPLQSRVERSSKLSGGSASFDFPITAIAISPDGMLVGAIAPQLDNSIRVWHVPTMEPVYLLADGHTRRVTSLSFSDRSTILTGAEDGRLLAWQLDIAKHQSTKAGEPSFERTHVGNLTSLLGTLDPRSHPSGRPVVHKMTGECARLVATHSSPITAVDCRDRLCIVTDLNGAVTVANLATWATKHFSLPLEIISRATTLKLLIDKERVAVPFRQGVAILSLADAGEVLQVLRFPFNLYSAAGGAATPHTIWLSPNCSTLAAVFGARIVVWSLVSSAVVHVSDEVSHPGRPLVPIRCLVSQSYEVQKPHLDRACPGGRLFVGLQGVEGVAVYPLVTNMTKKLTSPRATQPTNISLRKSVVKRHSSVSSVPIGKPIEVAKYVTSVNNGASLCVATDSGSLYIYESLTGHLQRVLSAHTTSINDEEIQTRKCKVTALQGSSGPHVALAVIASVQLQTPSASQVVSQGGEATDDGKGDPIQASQHKLYVMTCDNQRPPIELKSASKNPQSMTFTQISNASGSSTTTALITVSSDRQVRVWNATLGTLLGAHQLDEPVLSLQWSSIVAGGLLVGLSGVVSSQTLTIDLMQVALNSSGRRQRETSFGITTVESEALLSSSSLVNLTHPDSAVDISANPGRSLPNRVSFDAFQLPLHHQRLLAVAMHHGGFSQEYSPASLLESVMPFVKRTVLLSTKHSIGPIRLANSAQIGRLATMELIPSRSCAAVAFDSQVSVWNLESRTHCWTCSLRGDKPNTAPHIEAITVTRSVGDSDAIVCVLSNKTAWVLDATAGTKMVVMCPTPQPSLIGACGGLLQGNYLCVLLDRPKATSHKQRLASQLQLWSMTGMGCRLHSTHPVVGMNKDALHQYLLTRNVPPKIADILHGMTGADLLSFTTWASLSSFVIRRGSAKYPHASLLSNSALKPLKALFKSLEDDAHNVLSISAVDDSELTRETFAAFSHSQVCAYASSLGLEGLAVALSMEKELSPRELLTMSETDILKMGSIDCAFVAEALSNEANSLRLKGLKAFMGKSKKEVHEWAVTRRPEVRFAVVLLDLDAPAMMAAVGADEKQLYCSYCQKQVIDPRTWCPLRARDHADMEEERVTLRDNKVNLVVSRLREKHAAMCKSFCDRIQRLPSARFAHGMYWHPTVGDTSFVGAVHFELPQREFSLSSSINVNRATLTVFATTRSDVRLVVVPLEDKSASPSVSGPLSFSNSMDSDTLLPMAQNPLPITAPKRSTLLQLAGISSTIRKVASSQKDPGIANSTFEGSLPLGWVSDTQRGTPVYHCVCDHAAGPSVTQKQHPTMPSTFAQRLPLESSHSGEGPAHIVEVSLVRPQRDSAYLSVPSSPLKASKSASAGGFSVLTDSHIQQQSSESKPKKSSPARLHSFLNQGQNTPHLDGSMFGITVNSALGSKSPMASNWGGSGLFSSFGSHSDGGLSPLSNPKFPPVDKKLYFKKEASPGEIHEQHKYTVDLTEMVRREVISGQTHLVVAIVAEAIPPYQQGDQASQSALGPRLSDLHTHSDSLISANAPSPHVFPSVRPKLEVRLTDVGALCGCKTQCGPETALWSAPDQPPLQVGAKTIKRAPRGASRSIGGRQLCDRYCNSASACVGHSCLRDAVSCRYAPHLSWRVHLPQPGEDPSVKEASFQGVDTTGACHVPEDIQKLIAEQNEM